MSATPITTIVASPLTPVNAKPFFNSWIIASPIAVPQIVPEPPKMLVPPSTTAAITSSSYPMPMSMRVVVTRETSTIAASPEARPDSV